MTPKQDRYAGKTFPSSPYNLQRVKLATSQSRPPPFPQHLEINVSRRGIKSRNDVVLVPLSLQAPEARMSEIRASVSVSDL
jgi:hypothetical protein